MVEQMYQLLTHHEVKITSDDLVQLDELRSYQVQYNEETEASNTYRDERLPEMTQQLDMNIARLNDQLVQISGQLEEGVFVNVAHFDDPSPVISELEAVHQKLESVDGFAKQYTANQELFGITPYNYKNLRKTQESYDRMLTLWTMVQKWNEQYEGWMSDQFTELDVEEINKEVQLYAKESFSLHKKLNTDVTAKLKDKSVEFKNKMPIVLELGNPCMKDRHWEKIFTAIGQDFIPGVAFSLEDLLQFGVANHTETVSEVSAAASGEAQLEASLETVEQGWADMEFVTLSHRDQKGVYILGGLEEVLTLLEDNQVTLQTMMGSRFITGVQDAVEGWEKKLALLSETLDEWITVQRNWMYLETIFSCAEDIQKQLPVESQKFNLIDKTWKATLKATNEDPKVISCIKDGPMLLHQFQHSNKTLEDIQKSLEDYLQTKRMAFPRFYFLSNDDLLEILSQTRDPHAVQPHMSKCFDAVKRITFGEGPKKNEIQGYQDPSGEYVCLTEGSAAEGPVEKWLKAFENGMLKALYDKAKNALLRYPAERQGKIDRGNWLFSYTEDGTLTDDLHQRIPAQCIILVDQIFWTQDLAAALGKVESGEDAGAMETFYKFVLDQIDAMVKLVQGDLNKQQRTMIGALTTIDVHARDVVKDMVKKKTCSLGDFEWTKQLRYYWEEDVEDCAARPDELWVCFPTRTSSSATRAAACHHAADRHVLPHADRRDAHEPRRRARWAGGHGQDRDD